MRRGWIVLSLLLVLSGSAAAIDGKITGTLLDEKGLPVPHMGVQACPTDIGFDGSLPAGTTDEHGRFVIVIRSLIKGITEHWAVYPYSRDGFYPRPNAFYGNDVPGPKVVELSPNGPEASVELNLGPPVGALIIHVIGVLGLAIQPTFRLAWASDASQQTEVTHYIAEKSYRQLAPANTNLTLVVNSPGYKTWSSAPAISVGSGQEMRLEVRLDPEDQESSAK